MEKDLGNQKVVAPKQRVSKTLPCKIEYSKIEIVVAQKRPALPPERVPSDIPCALLALANHGATNFCNLRH